MFTGDEAREKVHIIKLNKGNKFEFRPADDESVSLTPAFVAFGPHSVTVLDGQVLVDFDSGAEDKKLTQGPPPCRSAQSKSPVGKNAANPSSFRSRRPNSNPLR